MTNKLARFIRRETLSNKCSPISKVFLGDIGGEPALLVLNKVPIPDSVDMQQESTLIHQNDIYTSGTLQTCESLKYSIIHPATKELIRKYTQAEHVVVKETYELYRTRVLPHALAKGPNVAWIDNIFRQAEKSGAPMTTLEKEEVLYFDREFLICPDLKWDRKTMDSLYLLVLFRDPAIYTIRELTGSHIPLLLRIQEAVAATLALYSYRADQVKMYFHYYPTFYRAHIHVASIKTAHMGEGVGCAVLLHDVIENLKVAPEFYKQRTMEIVLSKGSYIYEAHADAPPA
ncbi:m7GpppX diphosphatase [Nematocida major]|uniref:m7GpppX diphosphatase n=1 Tax=Nematocida major TaxID=1912982 RepID=UPI00200721B9|nr:m7GpppX diphosphatase [Nematocida major]KAH9386491.1 m7GpppX diphosphatase [Nematocida major]